MRMTWRQMLNLTVSAALALASAPVQAVQIEIKQDIRFRQMRAGHQILGILKAGSVVDVNVPDGQMRYSSNGTFDLRKTLQAMLSRPQSGEIGYKNIYGQRMPLFKVTVVGRAAGSSYNATLGSSSMIALDFLERRGKAYVSAEKGTRVQTQEDTAVYSTGDGADNSTDTQAQGALPPCPTGTCSPNNGPVSTDVLNELAKWGSMAPAPTVQDETAGGQPNTTPINDETVGMQGFRPDVTSRSHPGRCNRFIETDGSYGDLGRMAIKEIESEHPDFDTSSSFADICPNYTRFSEDQKHHFQVWVLASVSLGESGCNDNAVNRHSPHGHARGLFQMEESTKYRSRRPYYHQYCEGNMKDAYANMRCALEIMDYHLVSPGHDLYSMNGNNYWAVLKDASSDTKKIIGTYRACR